MTAAESVFSRTNRAFRNANIAGLKIHEIDFFLAAQVMQISSRLFQMLDHVDPVKAEVCRRLWVLRSSIVFTALPFDDPSLGLTHQMIELEQSSDGLPDATQLIQLLKMHVAEIVSFGRNPKHELLLHVLAESIEKDDEHIGIFCALSAGSPPGWPSESSVRLSALSERLTMIRSRRNMRANVFGTVILPCACSNAPPTLLSELLYSGCAARLEMLLYKGERFQVSKRLMLPDDGVFEGRLQKTEMERELIVISGDSVMSEVDTWANESFWQGLHGAERRSFHSLVPANYVLFCDGTGTFLPENGRVLSLPASGEVADESDLSLVNVEELCEGDLIVLRSGDSGFLLDEASDRIMSSEDNETLFEIATDWKAPLEALLVTHSHEQIARLLHERGAPINAASIRHWVGPDVLGPGNERMFRELIDLLAEKGKIQKAGEELISYADSRWKCLNDLRGVRQKAGNLIRQELFKALGIRLRNGNGKLAAGTSIHLEGDTGAELLILEVSSVDRNSAYVPHSRLGQIDDLKGNKWLG